MIDQIILYTQINSLTSSLFELNTDWSFLAGLNYDENIKKRKSFRYFDLNRYISSKEEIITIVNFLQDIVQRIFKVPNSIELCFVDNKGIFGFEKPSILVFENEKGEFRKIDIDSNIDRDNLYIQEEMHDADGVFFFLWDLIQLPTEYTNNGRFYKEIIMMSGFLGQIISEFAEKVSWKGTLFAGVMESDWKSLVPDEFVSKKPIFAYAFQK